MQPEELPGDPVSGGLDAPGPEPQDLPQPAPTLNPIPYYAGAPLKPYKGERTGSIVLGIIAIVVGGGYGCGGLLVPLTLLAPVTANGPRLSVRLVVASVLVCIAVCGGMISVGIGAVRLRRWIRPIAIALGVLGVFSGVVSVIGMIAGWSDYAAANGAPGGAAAMPMGMRVAMFSVTVFITAVLAIGFPGAAVWFYRRPRVKEMLDYYDPMPRWTDRCPLLVLGLVIYLLFGSAGTLMALPLNIVPAFGIVLTGIPAAVASLALAGVMAYLALLVFRQRPAGWWGTLGYVLIWTAAVAATASRHAEDAVLQRMGLSADDVGKFGSAGIKGNMWTYVVSVLEIAYLIYVRRYFFGPKKVINPRPPDSDSPAVAG